MKRISFFSIIIFLFALNELSSQTRLIGERGIYTQGLISPVLINPGATGFQESQQLLFNYRNTWATFPGAPRTLTFNYNGPLGNRLGIGAQFLSDKFAAFESTKGALTISYSIESRMNKVGFGLSGEFVQHRLSVDQRGGLIDLMDDEITDRLQSTRYLDASFGAYGVYDDKIIYGLTIPSFISARLSDLTTENEPSREFGVIGHVGYRLVMDDKDVVLEPSIIVKSLMNSPFHVDLNLKGEFLNNTLTGGLTYTVGGENRLGFLIGAKVSNVDFYYSYGVSFHDFQQYNNGSHEFTVKLTLESKKKMKPTTEIINEEN